MSSSIIFIFLIPSFFLFKILFNELNHAVTSWQEILTREKFLEFYEQNEWLRLILSNLNFKMQNIQNQLVELTTNFASVILSQGREFLSGILSVVFDLMITILTMFFLFKEGNRISTFIYNMLPFPDELEERIGKNLLEVLDAMVRGTILISIAQGVFVGIFYWIFGLSSPVLYGSLAAIFSLVPLIGTSAIWLPATIYLYIQGHTVSAIFMGGLSFSTYLVLENIIKPMILHKKLPLHPIFLFLSILGGIAQWGIKGFILGPFVVTALVFFLELLRVWKEEENRAV